MLLSVHKQGVFDGHNIKGKIKIMTEKYKLKEKSRDLNRNSSRNKNETMFGSG
jgi:hypothetical protein